MKKIKLIIMTLLVFTLTGCFEENTLDNIDITTSVYPIEYIVNRLYGTHSNITSIYPKDTDANSYKVTDTLLSNYKDSELFIFNGLSDEKNHVKTFKNNNKDLKIIDATSSMTMDYNIEELWLDPNNMLTMANNIKVGFNEYLTQSVVKDEINLNYDNLKIDLTTLDGKYYHAAKLATNKYIIVSNNAFKFLDKYGINVISLDDESVTEKDIDDAIKLLNDGTCSYVYTDYQSDLTDAAKKVIESTNATKLELYTMSNLKDIDTSKMDYIALSNENLENIEKELN